MNTLLFIFAGLLLLAIFALAAGYEALRKYKDESFYAARMRRYAEVLAIVSAVVVFYGYFAAIVISDFDIRWSATVAWALYAVVVVATVFWWWQQREVLARCEAARKRRAERNEFKVAR